MIQNVNCYLKACCSALDVSSFSSESFSWNVDVDISGHTT